MLTKKVIRFVPVILLLTGIFLAAPVQAQDPRPPISPPEAGDGDGRGDGESRGASPAITCGAVQGQVLNWGYRPEPEINTQLKTGSWEVTDLTDRDGAFFFGNLGLGIARLDVQLSPADPLRPVVEDAVVYLTCDFPTYANLALTSSPTIESPVTLEMSAPGEVISWSESAKITLTIKNNLPTGISNVIVTDLMPSGLVALGIRTSAGVPANNLRIIEGGDDGQLVVAYLDKIAAGATETVTLEVMAIEDTPQTQARNTATLFYRESIAVQDSLEFTIARSNLAVPAAVDANAASAAPAEPQSGGATTQERTTGAQVAPQSQATATPRPQVTPMAIPTLDTAPEATPLAATTTEGDPVGGGSGFTPPQTDELLPQTGNQESVIQASSSLFSTANPELFGSLIGIGLVGAAFVAYSVRSWRQRGIY